MKRCMKSPRIFMAIVLLVLAVHLEGASGQTLTPLYQFGAVATDGGSPQAGLVQGRDGNFYGTTYLGGTNGDGTVFRISPIGNLTNLWQFSFVGLDGGNPSGVLLQGRDGNFYGTTSSGGTNVFSCGTVFQITPAGTLTTLHTFGFFDGCSPVAGLIQGSDGNLYGTTGAGGAHGAGNVYRISTNGDIAVLWSFCADKDPITFNCPDGGGGNPLVQGSDGYFYGASYNGGLYEQGTVFRMTSAGTLTTIYNCGASDTDAMEPNSGLVQGSDGYFYGVSLYGGTYGSGTVFQISSGGNLTAWSFGTHSTDGSAPQAGLVQGSDGYFYGTTEFGGTNNNGALFRINAAGNFTTLYQFGGVAIDGLYPTAALVQGSDGYFYGTTGFGGTNSAGTLFKYGTPLSPPPYPINQITGVQIAGTNIIFSIPSIAGETYQLQFSSSLKPTNWMNVASVSVTNSIGSLLTLTNVGGASTSQRFYRFDITP
jgi:uncharacterized repeat protein (TIGR03803 family)